MARKSLLGGLGITNTKSQDLQLLNNVAKPAPKAVRGGNVMAIIQQIIANVNKYLGQYTERVATLRTEEAVDEYITKAINCGEIAIDTETTGLDCLEDKVIGSCLYVPGEKAVYIPHAHISYITGQPLNNQISYEFMSKQYQRLVDNKVKLYLHNAKFDMRMIRSNFGVRLQPYWDSMIAAQLLNNIEAKSLKAQYALHIKHEEKTYDFSSLFKTIQQSMCPIDTFTLYAATDAFITYELAEWQKKQFENRQPAYKLFMEEEMPLLEIVADMEDTGVAIDFDYARVLHEKYSKLLEEAHAEVQEELAKLKNQIDSYRARFPACKLSNPVNILSPLQLSIIIYDVLQTPVVDNKSPRGTGEEILQQINLPLCKKILKVRGYEKLMGTYIDKIPASVNKRDKRIHAEFNQMGTETGRFSSNNPNLQNIPSHNTDIRKMFVATDEKHTIELTDCYEVPYTDDILTPNGWKRVQELNIGEVICGENNQETISNIVKDNDIYKIYV